MRRSIFVAAVAGVVMAWAPAVGAATETETTHLKNETETFTEDTVCLGEATITITYNAVFHTTENKNGSVMTGTITGKFEADPTAAGEPNYKGRFTQTFREIVNKKGETAGFTFSVRGKATDGSGRIRIHQVAHITTNKNGTSVEFEKTKC